MEKNNIEEIIAFADAARVLLKRRLQHSSSESPQRFMMRSDNEPGRATIGTMRNARFNFFSIFKTNGGNLFDATDLILIFNVGVFAHLKCFPSTKLPGLIRTFFNKKIRGNHRGIGDENEYRQPKRISHFFSQQRAIYNFGFRYVQKNNGAVIRALSHPASAKRKIWATVASVFIVRSVAVMDCVIVAARHRRNQHKPHA